MTSIARKLVSKKKLRFTEDGFDLDLSYVTDNIIAMGFPSEKMEGLYRNPIEEVVRFFETRHKGSYKIWNLCSERSYDPSWFGGNVECFPFDDHNAPRFDSLVPFCRSVDDWLSADPKRVAAIHCKAGKGRTGVMICMYLVFSGVCASAAEALEFYAKRRTQDQKGVTIPSQKRYVEYFGRAFAAGFTHPVNRPVYLKKIVISPPPIGGCTPSLVVETFEGIPIFDNTQLAEKPRKYREDEAHIQIDCGRLKMCGDFKFALKDISGFSAVKMFHFWINSTFVPEDGVLVLRKPEIDKAHKDKKHKKYPPDLCVTLTFEIGEVEESSNPLYTSPIPSMSGSSSSTLLKAATSDVAASKAPATS